jgi:dTMP kinase
VFVTFEGPEGAGKSTALRAVADRLRAQGLDVVITREPGTGDFGRQIREMVLHGEDMPPIAELFLFLADRANHVETFIRPALARGQWVLCDRHIDSTFVYQSVARGLDPDFVRAANRFATGGLLPNRTLLFDIDPEIGLARLSSPDRLDAQPLSFHQKVREGFLTLAGTEPERFRVLDASESPDRVVDAAVAALGR